VRLYDAHDILGIEEPAQAGAADLRCGADLLHRVVELGGGDARRIGDLHELSAPLGQGVDDLLAGFSLYPLLPIVPVDHEVGLDALQVGPIVQGFLGDDGLYAFDRLYYRLAHLEGEVGQTLIAGDGLVGQ
jgi:hypothetical protein